MIQHESYNLYLKKLSFNYVSSFIFQCRTCFYVLGLIGSTSLGAEKLEHLGWDSVRHKCSEDWPVMEPDIGYFYEEMSDDEEVWAFALFLYFR